MESMSLFISAVITTTAAALVGMVFAGVKSIVSMKKSLEKMNLSMSELVESDEVQIKSIQAIIRWMRPSLGAHKATLEALHDGKCNGNVTEAQEKIAGAFDDYDNFLVNRVGV